MLDTYLIKKMFVTKLDVVCVRLCRTCVETGANNTQPSQCNMQTVFYRYQTCHFPGNNYASSSGYGVNVDRIPALIGVVHLSVIMRIEHMNRTYTHCTYMALYNTIITNAITCNTIKVYFFLTYLLC